MMNNDFLIQSEQSVIGSVLVLNNCFDDISLRPDEFLNESHRIIYSVICEYLNAGKPIDLILLAEHLQKQGKLDHVGGLNYIGAMVENAVSIKTVSAHARKISEGHKLRNLKQLVGTLENLIEEKVDINQIIETAESGLCGILDNSEEQGLVHISKAIAEAVDWEETDEKGLSTGLRDLDRLTNGFKNSELIIVAGRPSMGKSALAFQIAEHVSNRESVIIFSLEMAKRQIAARFLKFHEGRVGRDQAVSHLYGLQLHIDESPAITLGHIRSECRSHKRKYGLSMIVIDYIQLMRGDGDNRTQEIGSISRGLKSIAKEFDIPVIALSQLSRKVDERADKRPLMSDLRESGEIEQDADVILFIYRDEVYHLDTEERGIAEIICRKNRNGATGDVTTKFAGDTTRFSDFNGERLLRVVPRQHRAFHDEI